MLIELRFDDLDLHEEPASGKSDEMDATLVCTNTCTGSHNTCGTALC